MTKISTRDSYGNTLAKLIVEDEKIVVLDADLSKSTKTYEAKKVCPERHFNIGIAEGNMMSIAAGLAASGKKVFASTFAMFASGRAFEQIRNSICYPKLNVKICATHAGITLGEDGASHQAIEDISLMRSIPNMKVYQPCDAIETREIIKYVAKTEGPCYVRLGRMPVENVYDDDYKFEEGKGVVLHKGENVAIITSGLMVQEVLKAKDFLNVNPTIINIHTIKPMDKDLISELAKTHEYLISIEEHNVVGGLGSAIAEVLSPLGLPSKHFALGINDTFGRSGKPRDLLKYYKLDANSIAESINHIIE